MQKLLKFDKDHERAECYIPESLEALFATSKIAGVTPVCIKKQLNACRVTLSSKAYSLSCFMITIVNIFSLTGLIFDFTAPPEKATRSRNIKRKTVWLVELMMNVFLTGYIVYFSRIRTKHTLSSLNQVYKIKNLLSTCKRSTIGHFEFKMTAVLAAYVTAYVLMAVPEYIIFVLKTISNDRDWYSTILYFFFYFSFFTLLMFRLTFISVVMEVNGVLSSLNCCLETIGSGKVNQAVPYDIRKDSVFIIKTPARVTNTKYNNQNEGKIGDVKGGQAVADLKKLMKFYDAVYLSIQCLDKSYGVELLMTHVVSVYEVILTAYNIIVTLKSPPVDILIFILQFIWFLFHITGTVGLIEVCHRTKQKVSQTCSIVANLTIDSTDELLSAQLARFHQYLTTNKVSYSPMEMITMSRSLIASMAGSITTYLVIFVQFQGADIGEY